MFPFSKSDPFKLSFRERLVNWINPKPVEADKGPSLKKSVSDYRERLMKPGAQKPASWTNTPDVASTGRSYGAYKGHKKMSETNRQPERLASPLKRPQTQRAVISNDNDDTPTRSSYDTTFMGNSAMMSSSTFQDGDSVRRACDTSTSYDSSSSCDTSSYSSDSGSCDSGGGGCCSD